MSPPTEERFSKEVHFQGVRPVIYEHTAWDLALATQALSYLKPELAFDISKVYTQQNAFQTLENSFLASSFTPANMSIDNPKGMASAIVLYLIDVNQQEPTILQLYDKVIPEVKAHCLIRPLILTSDSVGSASLHLSVAGFQLFSFPAFEFV